MDVWLMSRLHSTVKTVTENMDGYNLVKASRTLMEFVTELSTWYLRRSRDRLRTASTESEDLHCFGTALYTLAQLFAPFTPFFSEVMYHNLVDESASIHHTDWPKVQTALINLQLEKEMASVQSLTEKTHAQRAEHGIKVRQPLASVTVTSSDEKLSEAVVDVLLDEVNVKQLIWEKGDEQQVRLETQLTPELRSEGEARELIRSIQQLRKKTGLSPKDVIEVTAESWPADWEEKIKTATHADKLTVGQKLTIEKI
jgi:isoleucyl-tRNA synthetase